MIPRRGGFPVSKDLTLTGVKITGMASLTADDGAVILPKLFRRLKEYLDLKWPTSPKRSFLLRNYFDHLRCCRSGGRGSVDLDW